MIETKIKKLLKDGESINVESKSCKTGLSSSVFVTAGSFLNRFGGEIFLGVV